MNGDEAEGSAPFSLGWRVDQISGEWAIGRRACGQTGGTRSENQRPGARRIGVGDGVVLFEETGPDSDMVNGRWRRQGRRTDRSVRQTEKRGRSQGISRDSRGNSRVSSLAMIDGRARRPRTAGSSRLRLHNYLRQVDGGTGYGLGTGTEQGLEANRGAWSIRLWCLGVWYSRQKSLCLICLRCAATDWERVAGLRRDKIFERNPTRPPMLR
ncbi:hypothetical protein B0H67DRAFT_570598 [Lasiosphaeris hirsuta]|uniref:Uncharacterized protein n=1 Tax=Lasiosphaeris hirsuta TaxID=260670 RepID=A0AA40E668_9PEZI|nr:hypothetical protein B0H67DRAFT_570598 [Lasiosphaeris hirsuta]